MQFSSKKIFRSIIIGISFGLMHFLVFQWQTMRDSANFIEDRWLDWFEHSYFLPFVLLAIFLFLLQLKLLARVFIEKKLVLFAFSLFVCYISFWELFILPSLWSDNFLLRDFSDAFLFGFVVFPIGGSSIFPLWFLTILVLSFPFVYYFLKGESKRKRFFGTFVLAFIIAFFTMSIIGAFSFN